MAANTEAVSAYRPVLKPNVEGTKTYRVVVVVVNIADDRNTRKLKAFSRLILFFARDIW
jgi:hypothetical protein